MHALIKLRNLSEKSSRTVFHSGSSAREPTTLLHPMRIVVEHVQREDLSLSLLLVYFGRNTDHDGCHQPCLLHPPLLAKGGICPEVIAYINSTLFIVLQCENFRIEFEFEIYISKT